MLERFLCTLDFTGLVIFPVFSLGINLQMLSEVWAQMRAPEPVTVFSCVSSALAASLCLLLFSHFQTVCKMSPIFVIFTPFFTDCTRICRLKSFMSVICLYQHQSRHCNLELSCSLFQVARLPVFGDEEGPRSSQEVNLGVTSRFRDCQEHSWGQGWAKGRPGHEHGDGQDSVEPMARQGRTIGARCGITGAGTDGPQGADMGPSKVGGPLRRVSGTWRPTSATKALTSLDNPAVLCFCFPKYCDNHFMVIILMKSIRQNERSTLSGRRKLFTLFDCLRTPKRANK